ncbi:MAG: hypothetical protein QOF89_3628 [Acidobacteriota bacterium]|jgi:hypothetical protein|nr:hypothetical protein [Acidobacteriota bacterium]
MDQELIAYFDERFREASRHNESLHARTGEQIAGFRQETGEQIAGLRQETGGQIAGLRQEIADLRQETTEQIRHTQILVEDMNGKLQLVAEGYFGIEERMKAFQDQVEENFKVVHSTLDLHYRAFESRLRIVEERTKRKGRDPLELLREMYDKGTL